jgi:hypothetical protein
MAMGGNFTGSPFSEIWNGTSWSLRSFSIPFHSRYPSSLGFDDVSCSSPAGCIAVGEYSTSGGPDRPLAYRWDGLAWRFLAVPQRRQSDSVYLDGVSCLATGCMAVGFEWGGSVNGPLAEWWDGSTWTIESSIDTSDVLGFMGVSCTSKSFCIAAAWNLGPRLDRWDGHVWSSVPPVVPAGVKIGGFVSASCSAPTSCIAVANAQVGTNETFPIADRWDGATWSAEVLPHHAGDQFMDIEGVSCSDSNDCVAVGLVYVGNAYRMLIERWNGVTWTMETAPEVRDAALKASADLRGVSCAQGSCTAVGSAAVGYQSRTLALRSAP